MTRVALITLLSLLLFTSWGQSNLTQAEYFFDNDPGIGSALPITGFASSNTIDVNDLLDVSGLPIGLHTLGIRVMDDNLVWSMAEYLPVLVTPASANIVANITAAEYFFDSDPGLGSGFPITLTATQKPDIMDMIPTSGLSPGIHTLNIRIRNEFNEWSMVETIPVFVTQASAQIVVDIDAVEYFFGPDPGNGLATPLTITVTQNLEINELIPTASLSTGIHIFNIRIRTTNGEWSLTESIPILVNPGKQITQLEHFVDTDPGLGAATNIAITPPSTNIDEDVIIPTGSLALGNHTFNARIGGASVWGQAESVIFNVCAGALPDFTATNTCIGDPTNFTDVSTGVLSGDSYLWDFENDGITDNTTNGDVSFTYASSGTFTTELQIDQGGCVGYKYNTVEVVDLPTSTAGLDQIICEGDPVSLSGAIGGSATTSLWTTSGTGSFTDDTSPSTTYTPDAGDISSGSVVLSLTASEPLSACSDVLSQITITIRSLPTANAGSDFSICDNGIVSLNGSIGGGATTGTWMTSGDGTFDNPNLLNATYTPGANDIATGSVTLDLTTDDVGGVCPAAASSIIITIEQVPTANAGTDQSICNSSTTLTATPANAGETGVWSIISGSGNFSDVNDPNASFTGITSNNNQLRWTVSNDLLGCTDFDDMVVVSNQPITTASVQVLVALGQTIESNVQSSASTNPGDNITTTIITQPIKGVAAVLANGDIQYTPNNGTVGMDTVFYRLCNQCNNCVDSYLAVDIQNNGPVIQSPPVSTDSTGTVIISLLALISDLNDNLDLSTLRIVQQPQSGAVASIDANSVLRVDYTDIVFVGTDEVIIEVCDLLGACTTNSIFIDVNLPGLSENPPITVYNAVSPNRDEKHDFLEIKNITAYTSNSIVIFNRWGRKVYEGSPYDNDRVKFDGTGNVGGAKDLPAGTYFYRLDLGNGVVETGFLVLKN